MQNLVRHPDGVQMGHTICKDNHFFIVLQAVAFVFS